MLENLSYFNYRLFRKTIKSENSQYYIYDLKEVYYDDKGNIIGHSLKGNIIVHSLDTEKLELASTQLIKSIKEEFKELFQDLIRAIDKPIIDEETLTEIEE